jgi:hypothetical protein
MVVSWATQRDVRFLDFGEALTREEKLGRVGIEVLPKDS